MVKPKVTIGIVVKNGAATIGETIESVKAQDFPRNLMEIIFVDGGSRDNTVEIIQKNILEIDMPHKIFYTSSKGLGHDRNVVIDNATGEYIIWVDSDMLLSKDFVRTLVQFMDEHSEVGAAKGMQALEPCSNLLATLESYSRAAGRMVDYDSKKAQTKSLGTAGAIHRVEVLKQVGGFDDSIKGYGEDWDVEIRIRKAGWSLHTVDTKYSDYERYGLAWKDLWSRYWRRGYDTHYFFHKNSKLTKHYRMFPPAAFVNGVLHSRRLFYLTHQKSVFLLPIQYLFKMTAWYVGFIRSHMDAYQPN